MVDTQIWELLLFGVDALWIDLAVWYLVVWKGPMLGNNSYSNYPTRLKFWIYVLARVELEILCLIVTPSSLENSLRLIVEMSCNVQRATKCLI